MINTIRCKLFLLLIFTIAVSFTGCYGNDDYRTYLNAVEKTRAIAKASHSVEVEVNQEMENKSEKMKFEMTGHFDTFEDKAIYQIYYLYGGLGNDINYYKKSKDEQYIKIPMVKEYIDISKNANDKDYDSFEISKEFEEMGKIVSEEWKSMIKKENVFVGEKITIENEDGSVKARKYTIRPTGDQLNKIKDIALKFILENKSKFIISINKFEGPSGEKCEITEIEFEDIIKGLMDTAEFRSYEEISYVDSDGYIIDEVISIGISYKEKEGFKNPLKYQTINITNKKWNIGKTEDFKFPKIGEKE